MSMTPMKTISAEDDGSEGITVAIRMRPLNDNEGNKERIWKVLPKYSSVTQTTRDGKPLGERVTGRTFFTFDKTFGEDTNNRKVYDGVAKGIVGSVVQGLNGTIFAYGQTSSGKTYTMQGSGNLEQGSLAGGEGGLVHMAAKDIFSQIQSQPDRMFLVRVSFLEIYNEEVRDLLAGSSQNLQIREDPRRGVFVQSEEEIVTDFDCLLKILVRGDKSRTFAATGMNERSSRSHTILRVTIESREKEMADESAGDEDDEDRVSNGDGAVRVSTLNLVDLAGSESVRHTGATGERQKEGGLINQSLLTLSRVIVALGTPNQTHVNFRDSKLTRILQPSLSGNARMAVICCATPSELYLEETRSTLQFASRAKLVKTNAQVNEVLDERSMIRRLQRELAEAKRRHSGMGDQQMKALEKQVETAGTEAMEAKAKLDRLKASILNAGYLFDQVAPDATKSGSSHLIHASKKRRKSDGPLLIGLGTPLKGSGIEISSPKTAPRQKRTHILHKPTLLVKEELNLVREALAVQNRLSRELNGVVSEYVEQMMGKDSEIQAAASENRALNQRNSESKEELQTLSETVASLQESIQASIQNNEKSLIEKEVQVKVSLEKLEQSLGQKEVLEEHLRELQCRFDEVQQERARGASKLAEMTSEKERLAKQAASDKNNLQEMAGKTEFLTASLDESIKEKDDALLQIESIRSEMEIMRTTYMDVQRDQKSIISELEEKVEALEDANEELLSANAFYQSQLHASKEEGLSLQDRVKSFEEKLVEQEQTFCLERQSIESQLYTATMEINQLSDENDANEKALAELRNAQVNYESSLDDEIKKCSAYQVKLSDMEKDLKKISAEKIEKEQLLCDLQQKCNDSTTKLSVAILEKNALVDEVSFLKDQQKSLGVELEENGQRRVSLEETNRNLQEKLEIAEKEITDMVTCCEAFRSEKLKTAETFESSLKEARDELEFANSEKQKLLASIEELSQASTKIESAKGLLEQTLKSVQSDKDAAEAALKVESERLATISDERDLVLAEKNSAQALLNSYKGKLSEMEAQLAAAEGQLSRLQLEKDAAMMAGGQSLTKIQKLSSELSTARKEVDELKRSKMEVDTICDDTQAQLVSLKAQVIAHEKSIVLKDEEIARSSEQLQAEHEEVILLQKCIEDTNGRREKTEKLLDSRELAFDEAQSRIIQLQTELEVLNGRSTFLTSQLDESKTLSCELQLQIENAKMMEAKANEELERISASRDIVTQNLRDCEAQRDETTAEVERLYVENRLLSSSISTSLPKQREDELESEILTLKSCNIELQQLLASVNESEERLRDTVSRLENELRLKSSELDNLALQLSRREEEIEQTKLDREKQPSLADTHIESLQRIQYLQQENAQLEQALLNEKDSWKPREEELMRQMGEEQRALLREGETLMANLRNELTQCEAKLSQAESEAYTARQQLEEMGDERRSFEQTHTGLEERLSVLDSTNAEQKSQINQLQNELSKTKSECYALKESAIDMKEKMRRTIRDSDKATKESEKAAKEIATLRKKMSNMEKQIEDSQIDSARLRKKYTEVGKIETQIRALEQKLKIESTDNDTLRKKITDLEREKEEASSATENGRTTRSGDSGSREMTRLRDEIKQKDQRIKKLEAVRMTKDQMAKIKGIKVANKELETKCASLKHEIQRLGEQAKSRETDSDLRTEVSELRFDKEALERKLRKFATHCQRLEDDKAGMADSLRSCNVDIGAYGNDISEAIIHLCDKLASVEQSPSSFQSQADLASNDNALEQEMAAFRETIDVLTEKLDKSRNETNQLRKLVKTNSAGPDMDEFQRKLRFLEEENLQLHQDLKKSKEQLSLSKDELAVLRSQVRETQTFDFTGMGIDAASTSSIAQGHDGDTKELTRMARQFSGNPAALKPPRESRTSKLGRDDSNKRQILSDSTNQSENGDLITKSSETKRRRVGEGTKSIRQRRTEAATTASSSTPGLGESSSIANAESTGECSQS